MNPKVCLEYAIRHYYAHEDDKTREQLERYRECRNNGWAEPAINLAGEERRGDEVERDLRIYLDPEY